MNRDKFLQILGAVHDVAAALAAFYAAHIVIFGAGILHGASKLHLTAVIFAGAASVCFSFFALNSGAWRYASLPDLTAIIKATFTITIVYSLVEILVTGVWRSPAETGLLISIFLICALGGPRLAYRVVKQRGYLARITGNPAKAPMKGVLLFGVNDNAESYIRAMRNRRTRGAQICGLIDDTARLGMAIQGVKVLGRQADIEKIMSKLNQGGTTVTEIIVTSHDVPRGTINNLVSAATGFGLKVSRIPDISRTASVDNAPIRPDPIDIADLLGRPEIHLDARPVSKFVAGKSVLITGAGGSIGSELARQVACFKPARIILADISEYLLFVAEQEMREKFAGLEIVSKLADIRDVARMERLFMRNKPEIVFHAAALKHVPMAEDNVIECVKTNLLGVRNVADCSLKHGTECFVLVSTDKAINPSNIMGATKRAAEAYCQSLDLKEHLTRFKTVRFGNVLGSNGSVLPLFRTQIASGGPVTVTHPDVVRYFMTIPEAAKLVLKASAFQLPGDMDRGRIHVLEMGEPVRIADLAAKMIELAGFRPHDDIKIVYTCLRPGEKLCEELFAPEELEGLIQEDGFVIASARPVDPGNMNMALARLENAVAQADEPEAISALRMIVPEYKPAQMSDNAFDEEDAVARITA